ncbi:hypothetical protein [Bifidobacterium reuteri]|uniref:hypothetical protein n=1 Tax=Bifidobacterium reuteri TaxID=983706 RepID=UPI00168A9D83|nr:hypothetical protein [Bifidobacterium reuteri]
MTGLWPVAVNREESGAMADGERAGFGAVSRCDYGNAADAILMATDESAMSPNIP